MSLKGSTNEPVKKERKERNVKKVIIGDNNEEIYENVKPASKEKSQVIIQGLLGILKSNSVFSDLSEIDL